jgi:hypothetical protein
MKLYHFTPEFLLNRILSEGVTLGKIPILDSSGNVKSFATGCQWLTSDGGWDKQSWATSQLINYDRTACRMMIKIPKSSRDKLCKAHDILDQLPKSSQRLITDWQGSENWYLFFGRIPPGWIRQVDKKPGDLREVNHG